LVCSGLGNNIKHSSARVPELDAEVAGLCGDLLDRVSNVEWLRYASELNIIVFDAVEQVVVPPHALTVYGELDCTSTDPIDSAPDGMADSRQCTDQG
jgi:hypothetical protein